MVERMTSSFCPLTRLYLSRSESLFVLSYSMYNHKFSNYYNLEVTDPFLRLDCLSQTFLLSSLSSSFYIPIVHARGVYLHHSHLFADELEILDRVA